MRDCQNINKKHGSVIALGGNPNVGKSTLFNGLTGLRQHTGNWPGKTVATAYGYCSYDQKEYIVVDLPGCYSLAAHSAEEEVARDFIRSGQADAVIIVCDATCLERNLYLALQTMEITPNVVVCVNLMDEAEKKKIKPDLTAISEKLGVPVVGTTARGKKGLDALMRAAVQVIENPKPRGPLDIQYGGHDGDAAALVSAAEEICRGSITFGDRDYIKNDTKTDRFITGKWTAFPIMLLALLAVFWLTITGANYPSRLISSLLFWGEEKLLLFFMWLNAPDFLTEMLVLGIYRVLAWVVAVMLPPMAIFFPLFTLLEDVGFLPRVAFNLDKCFKKCRACGKQALTMCMGFGCNAAGVIGCRIIDSPRERLIAIITNNFVPCNGRFPTFIAIISMFFAGASAGSGAALPSAALLTCFIVLGVVTTLIVSNILSKTALKGVPSSFTLELPPYRRPQIGKVIIRSIFDRTLFVLGRAAAMAAPAGLVIWLMANTAVGGVTLLARCSGFLDPFANHLGLDGVILLAFILGFPANEIVIPIIIMAYMAEGSILELSSLSALKQLLTDNGWTWITAVSVMLFSLLHWPCSTTCLTIRKETQSLKWTLVSILVPTLAGIAVCFMFAAAAKVLT
ncbi:MAG: ferrous iron transporter B [Oscillospiraceae bacterium]|nr:ferrous iron transporter B [Oscillospiraceae bacterium]